MRDHDSTNTSSSSIAGDRACERRPFFRTVTTDPAETRETLGVSPHARLVVLMSNGGRGHENKAREHFAYSLAILSRVKQPDLSVLLALGPLFRSQVEIPAEFPHRITVLREARNLANVLYAANLAVCRSG
ncbi:hypothetical protein ACIHEI_05775 [Kitasatospora sp. NPDC051984]|uniref:hypothetical protein n=1 Tax=Kitasatospora sp. NPDC051984 TaxID=3364059 RepID=UPI0037CC9382